MLNRDTDRLWISDKRVEKLIIDTLNGKTPLATNARLRESAEALQAAVNELSDDLDFEVETIADYIYALNILTEQHTEDIQANTLAIEGLDGRLGTAEDNIVSLDGRLETAEGKIETAEGDITSLDTRLDTAEDSITSLGTRLDTAEGNITALDTRIGTAEGNITSLETFRDTTVPNTYCTLAQYNALEARVRALEQAQPT